MSVELSREAYTEHPAFLALCGDGPGVIIGVQLAANSPEFVRPLDPHFPDKFHSLQVAISFFEAVECGGGLLRLYQGSMRPPLRVF